MVHPFLHTFLSRSAHSAATAPTSNASDFVATHISISNVIFLRVSFITFGNFIVDATRIKTIRFVDSRYDFHILRVFNSSRYLKREQSTINNQESDILFPVATDSNNKCE